ncbi:MAG: carbamoyltransferase HypF [Staphylothermus sp.]|nr:carbamoyltransferase HypF [Staphylothermus sp.]
MNKRIALRILIIGLVQGVGFRPFIHRLAYKHNLYGYVKNTGGSEVEVWIEGNNNNVKLFLEDLYKEKPPPAIIEEVIVQEVTPRDYREFKILPSEKKPFMRSNIPPDFAICEECLREILDPRNRRYRYAFNSCAWCGPRFSMMYSVPYDRENTSMRKYVLCEECLNEYNDISNIRRYHAQGISCPRDGPQLSLYNNNWEEVETDNPIETAARLIDEGNIVAIKGIGGYHIAAKATDDDVVLLLRQRKNRPTKPFAIMGLDIDVLKRIVVIDDDAEKLLKSPQSPILLLPKRDDSPVSKYVSPELSHEGVFIAYTGLHYLLLMNTEDKFLIMTSGNLTGEPMCIDEICAREKLSKIADYFLVHDREIVNRVDDSVLRKTGNEWVFLRRSRGYAPLWIRIKKKLLREYIAFGADLNNCGAVGFDDKIVPTQYIGDLDGISAQNDLIKALNYYIKNYKINLKNTVVVVDKHPEYHSRRLGESFAKKHGLSIIEVQHHYSHVMGAAADNGLEGDIIGIAIDGVGWGDDNTIWGGEVFLFNTYRFGYSRVGSILQLPVTSDRDTIYPVRLVVGFLVSKGYNLEEILSLLNKKELIDKLPLGKTEVEAVYKLITNKRFIPASSTGRFLDMVSALLGIAHYRSYEGEPAIRLEAIADYAIKNDLLDMDVKVENGLYVLDYSKTILTLLEDDPEPKTFARSILYSYGYMLGEIVSKVAGGRKISGIIISGGAAVNNYIVSGIRDRLKENELVVYLPKRIPANDGGISFGQIVVADLYIDQYNSGSSSH